MGMRQMTFEIPEELAERFESEVPESEQSAVVAELLQRASRRRLTEEQWAAACDAANNDPETQEIQREMGNTLSPRKTKQMQDAELIAACDAVNADPELNALIEDWQAAADPIEEPWDEPAPR